MGNQAQTARKLPKNTRYNRNSYSLDEMSAPSKLIYKTSVQRQPASAQSQQTVQKPNNFNISISTRQIANSSAVPTIQSIVPQTIINIKSNEQNDQRLAKLNTKNDELRKQLIRMNSELTSRLQKKKYVEKKREMQGEGQGGNKIQGLRRQLQNGYKQIDRYKKIIEGLRGTENLQNQHMVNKTEASIAILDAQIKQVMNEIEAEKNIEKNQQIMIKKSEGESNSPELKQAKSQIERLKGMLKKISKGERKSFYSERLRQEYMFQLQRKYREMNGDYLPEIKSYANKNFVPEPAKYDKKKKDEEFGSYKPEKWQMSDLKEEIQTLKEKHEDYHLKIEKAIKNKTAIRQQCERLKQQLEQAQKTVETLHYKKDRYLQLVMGNIEFLMNEDDDLSGSEEPRQNGSIRVITKGGDVQDQVPFDDHNLIRNLDIRVIKIVSINVWYTNKHQIGAIQVIYFNGKDCFMGNRTSQVSEDMQKEVLQVDEGDYIKNIMGSFSKKGAIQFLAFNSVRGKAKQFGKEMINGLNFSLGLSKGERPVCLSGCSFFDGSYWRINKLITDVVYDE